ncbi:MAG: DUF1214 domain-containing protein [Actinomycetes bacterium]
MAADDNAESTDALAGAWRELLDGLEASGNAVAAGVHDPVELAEGYRFVTRLLSASLDMTLENGDPVRPGFTRLMTPSRKFFGDNPDTAYDYAPLTGPVRYLVEGTRGTCHYLSFCVYGPDASGANRILGSVSDEDLTFDADGRFRLVLAVEAPEPGLDGEWLATAPEADALVVRQYFLDRDAEVEASYRIAPIDDPGPPKPPAPDRVARRLRAVAAFTRIGTELSAGFARMLEAGEPNTFSVNSAERAAAFYPTPDNVYVAGWYRLEPGEALEITGRPPAGRYWSVLLMSRWMESLDYRHHRIILNQRDAVLEPDGRFRILVADRDPGVPNWLDTAGHHQGYVMFRWLRSEIEHPQCRVVRLDDPSPAA